MKKNKILLYVVTILIVLIGMFSLTFGKEQDKNYLNDELYNSILFDYNYLTHNNNETARRIFNSLKETNFTSTDNNVIISLGVPMSSYKDNVIFIQENYKELINNLTSQDKLILDSFLLDNVLQYYYNELDESYVCENTQMDEDKLLNVPSSVSSDTQVAIIKVCSDPSPNNASSSGTGLDAAAGHHSWIQVQNIISNPIAVGGLTIPGFKAVTVGTWNGIMNRNHSGIWYGAESACASEFSNGESVYLSATLTVAELNRLTAQIRNGANDTWSLRKNCSYFASKMWNVIATSNNEVSAGLIPTPVNLKNSILENGGSVGLNLPMDIGVYYGGANPVFFRDL